MNDEIKQRLLTYLDSMEGSIEKAVDFTSDQVPLYVQELCQYGVFSNSIPVLIAVTVWVLAVLTCLVFNYAIRKEDREDRAAAFCLSLAGMTVLTAFIGSLACDYGSEAYKAAYCPRVYVVEQIHELVK